MPPRRSTDVGAQKRRPEVGRRLGRLILIDLIRLLRGHELSLLFLFHRSEPVSERLFPLLTSGVTSRHRLDRNRTSGQDEGAGAYTPSGA